MKANTRRWWSALLAIHLTLIPALGVAGKGPDAEKLPDIDGALDSQDVSAESISELEGSLSDDAGIGDTARAEKLSPDGDSATGDGGIDDALLLEGDSGAAKLEAKTTPPPAPTPSAEMELIPDDLPLAPPAPVVEAPRTAAEAEPIPDDLLSDPVGLPAPAPVSAPPVMAASNVKNVITNLEFRMEGQNSRIVVKSRGPLRYREVRNSQVKQIVYFFDNTETPNRFQRAYDTTEFVSPVALFTMLQMPKESPPMSKLIVQLREDKTPTVTPDERGLVIEFPPADKKEEPRLLLGDNDPRLATEENIYSGAQTFNGRSISRLEIKNSDIQDVLRLIAKSSGYNIVVGDDVSGKVGTLSLQNVPWDQAFTLVLQSKKLGYVRQGNVIRVATLDALKGEKEQAMLNEATKIKIEPLRTILIPISYAKAGDLSAQAKNFLTERGTLDVDNRTNTIIVKDIDRAVARIQKLFAALDTQPPRVSISARFVEVNTEFTRDLGFNNATAAQNVSGVNVNANFNYGAAGISSIRLAAPDFANLLTEFKLQEIDSRSRTLANPSVTVVANQQATVSQTFSFFVISGQNGGGVFLVPEVKQITATLSLDVTPIVAGDGSIFLTLNIKNEIPKGKPPDLQIDARNVSTQVLLDNGDTAVVGGVFNNNILSSKTGMPFLMRLPILGFFFSSSTFKDTKAEILIFVTAKILNAEEAFKRTL